MAVKSCTCSMVSTATDSVATSADAFEVQEGTDWTDDGHGHLLRHLRVMIIHRRHEETSGDGLPCQLVVVCGHLRPRSALDAS